MIELVYWDFKNHPITVEQYKDFLVSYYGKEADARYARMMWYHQRGNYEVLIALEDGKPLGQASAYQVFAFIQGERNEFWWSVDTFVLPAARGKGIGKKLQKKLHEDFPNFSSVWYSKINGFIKRKCGAQELLKVPFNYYPINSFFSVLFRVVAKRLFHRNLSAWHIGKNKYFMLNQILRRKTKFIIQEVALSDKLEELMPLIASSLKNRDFYVIRNIDYLSWKYLKNPTIGEYKTLFFYSANHPDQLIGAIIFSVPYYKKVFSIPLKVFTILDCFTFSESLLPKSEVLCSAIKYFYRQEIIIDGVLALEDLGYFPFFRYPWKGTALLSTYIELSKVETPYLAYSDQDMEQMIF